MTTGLPDSPATQLLHSKALEYEAAAIGTGTASAYREHFKYFVRFCLLFGLVACMFEPSETVIVWFAVWLARSCNPRVVRTYLSGVKYYLLGAGVLKPGVWEMWAKLPRVLKGIKRLHPTAITRKLAIEPHMLVACMKFVPFAQPLGLCIWAAVLVCFFGFLRKAHVCVQGQSLTLPTALLLRKHVVVDLINYQLIVTIQFSKTMQFGERTHVLHIKGLKGCILDPVYWVGRYFVTVPAPPDSPCFVVPGANGVLQPLTYSLFVSHLKKWLTAAGFNAADYSGHSLRRGGATTAFKAGVDPLFVQHHGDWSSDCWLLYIGFSKEQKEKVSLGMLAYCVKQGLAVSGTKYV